MQEATQNVQNELMDSPMDLGAQEQTAKESATE